MVFHRWSISDLEAAFGRYGINGGGVVETGMLRGSDSRRCRLRGVFWNLWTSVVGGGAWLIELHGGEEEHVVRKRGELVEIGGL